MPDARSIRRLCATLLTCVALALTGCSDEGSARDVATSESTAGAVALPGNDTPADVGGGVETSAEPAAEPAPAPVVEDTRTVEETAAPPAEPLADPDCPAEPASAYPSDAPYYPSANASETCRSADGRIKQVSTTPDSGVQVYSHMTRSLEAQGWVIQSKFSQSGQFALDANKANRQVAVLIADREIVESGNGLTRITVLVSP